MARIATRNITATRTRAPADAGIREADQRKVAGWFKAYEGTRSVARKAQLTAQICSALKVHTRIEEEIFYLAFLAATQDPQLHQEAVLEEAAAGKLLEIDGSEPWEEYFDAKVRVLSEMIRQHIRGEEQPEGVFAATKSNTDLALLGRQLRARRNEVGNRSKSRSIKNQVATSGAAPI
jgi:hypothetical protein